MVNGVYSHQLKLIVLIKQVPEISKVKFDIEKGRLDRSSAGREINPFDLNALEAALQIKEKLGCKITALSMGPPQADEALREALARGADEAILLTDNRFAGSDTLATSFTLAQAVRKIGDFAFILCGEKTVDGDTGQVGPEVAEHLGIPHVAYVAKILEVEKEKLRAISRIGKHNYTIDIAAPGLITVTKDVNVPRYLSFSKKLKAKSLEVPAWKLEEVQGTEEKSRFGVEGSPTRVFRVNTAFEKNKETRFLGSGTDGIRELAENLEKIVENRR